MIMSEFPSQSKNVTQSIGRQTLYSVGHHYDPGRPAYRSNLNTHCVQCQNPLGGDFTVVEGRVCWNSIDSHIFLLFCMFQGKKRPLQTLYSLSKLHTLGNLPQTPAVSHEPCHGLPIPIILWGISQLSPWQVDKRAGVQCGLISHLSLQLSSLHQPHTAPLQCYESVLPDQNDDKSSHAEFQ